MHSIEAIDLGSYRGENYQLVGFVEPKPVDGEDYDPDCDADGYGVTVFRVAVSPLSENKEIVRMDNCHGQPHLDKEYIPPDTDTSKKVWLDEEYAYTRMKRYLLTNWKRFVDEALEYGW
ncbi:DUF7718 family protein [Salinigranum halophilum]|uniref:DUF7718 family protein n=1 Tax=Salinigranum halophilum TaxID=2565931 RepID=UPI0010A824FE|nr:hypothetical protein [Salinigranum halophilum]